MKEEFNNVVDVEYTLMPSKILPDIKQTVKFTAAIADFDATPYKEFAEAQVAKYAALEFTEEDVKDVNKLIADLNNKAKDFDEVRKDIKREFIKPLTSFEEEMNSITSVYTQTVTLLKSKVNVFEQKFKDEKLILIQEILQELIKDFALESKYAANIEIDKRYFNKTETLKKIKEDLIIKCQQQQLIQKADAMALLAEQEGLQRRMTLLKELNAAYAHKICTEISYIETSKLSDTELRDYFHTLASQSFKGASDKWDSPLEPALVPDLGKAPTFEYHCRISTSSLEDDVLPWLKKMKEAGIITFVEKRIVR